MDITTKITQGRYETTVPYEYAIVPVDPDTMTVTKANLHIEEQKRLKQEQKKLYREDQARLNELFHKDVAEYCGMLGHPKEQAVYDFAYREGHSGGFHEILRWYEDLAALVK